MCGTQTGLVAIAIRLGVATITIQICQVIYAQTDADHETRLQTTRAKVRAAFGPEAMILPLEAGGL